MKCHGARVGRLNSKRSLNAMDWMEPLNEAPVPRLGEPLVATVLVDGALHIGSSRRPKRMRYLATANGRCE
jgi:hypothetical protein